MELGDIFIRIAEKKPVDQEWHIQAEKAIQRAYAANAWFTPENIRSAFASWAKSLEAEKIEKWLSEYKFERKSSKKVGIIMAGNIPMVGMHDLISVLVSNNIAVCKLSSKDFYLMDFVISLLKTINPELDSKIVTADKLKGIDAIIATGSNNSLRYFEHYFGKLPHLFRSNRTSIALLDGNESEEELKLLADDIFQYFGLGCRNVTKIYLPEDFDLDKIFKAVYHKSEVAQHHKYANNYDYNKAIYLLNNEPLLENGFMLLKEDEGLFTPVSVLFFERYSDKEKVKQEINLHENEIQCIVSNLSLMGNEVPFGKSQKPELWDYADRVDTLMFLKGLH